MSLTKLACLPLFATAFPALARAQAPAPAAPAKPDSPEVKIDPIQVKLDKLAARRQGDPNPFVVGQENYQKFLEVMSLCTQANIARRK